MIEIIDCREKLVNGLALIGTTTTHEIFDSVTGLTELLTHNWSGGAFG